MAEARALPEIEDEFFVTTKRALPDGTILNERAIRPLCGRGISGDDIIMFVDADGRAMKVVQTEDGPAKCEFWL
jgi:hypothetical protein